MPLAPSSTSSYTSPPRSSEETILHLAAPRTPSSSSGRWTAIILPRGVVSLVPSEVKNRMLVPWLVNIVLPSNSRENVSRGLMPYAWMLTTVSFDAHLPMGRGPISMRPRFPTAVRTGFSVEGLYSGTSTPTLRSIPDSLSTILGVRRTKDPEGTSG